ncbi:MAG: carbohydrate ABC transporter permease [candidate division NC10 bacterium]|nr:carbohydrate ABC transporter permease [candidate division NC10 bacterium]
MTSRNPALRVLAIALLGIVALVEVFPYFWIATTSLKDLAGVLQFPPSLLPLPPHWENYVQAWQSGPFPRYLLNNVITTFGILILQLFLGCLAAYAFSKLEFPGRDLCFFLVVACLMVPPQIRFIPIYIMLAKVGLLNTYAAIILPYATSALGTFLIREAFNGISDDILDAARIDGANVLQIIFRILVPIAKPTIIAFSLFSVVYHWNDYFWPLVMTTDEAVRTLPLGVALLREEGTGSRWHIIMAGNMFVVVPMILTFLAAQRHIIRAFTFTSPK